MAGIPGTLTRRGRALGPAMVIAGLCVALCGGVSAGEPARDVLTVEHPQRLVLFNKYQQRLSAEEYRRLPPFVPMVFVREQDHLGDGFTPCAAVEIDREPYYILRNEAGGFSTQGEPGRIEIFRNASLQGDSVVLLRGGALALKPAGGPDWACTPRRPGSKGPARC